MYNRTWKQILPGVGQGYGEQEYNKVQKTVKLEHNSKLKSRHNVSGYCCAYPELNVI